MIMEEEKILRRAYLYGAEADENSAPFSEYIEDFCLDIGIDKWRDIAPELKRKIRSRFNDGKAANKKAGWG